MRHLLPAFLAECAAPRTASTYAAILESFFAFVGVRAVAVPSCVEAAAFISRPSKSGNRRAAATRNLDRAALRCFAAFAARHGTVLHFGELPFEREPERDPCVMTVHEVHRLYEAVGAQSKPEVRARNLALLALLTSAALRVHELVGLNVDQCEGASQTLIGLRGKGGTVHDLPMNPETVNLVEAWLRVRGSWVEGDERALFVSRTGRRLSVRAVERLFVKLRTAIGTTKKITPHTARHSVATIAIEEGIDLSIVSQLLRHGSIRTTQRYIHLVDRHRRAATQTLGAKLVPRSVLPTSEVNDGVSGNVLEEDLDGVDHERLFDDPAELDHAA